MTERFSFAVDRHLIDSSVVWTQDNIDNSTLADTMNETYASVAEDSPTRYLSALDTTSDISLENLNITISNPKLEVEEAVETFTTEEVPEQLDSDQVVVFSVDGGDELYGIQVVQDEEGNMQKYQFQFRKNEDGQLEAIPETVTLIPMEEEIVEQEEYAQPTEEEEESAVHIFVQEDNSHEHILPDHHIEEQAQDQDGEDEQTAYENEELEEEALDIKPGLLQIQSVKQEIQEAQVQEYDTSDLIETHDTFHENLENQQITEFETLPEEVSEHPEQNFEYHTEIEEQPPDEATMDYQETEELAPDPPEIPEIFPEDEEDLEHVEVSPDMATVQTIENIGEQEETETFPSETAMNDSDENDYHIVEGLHITGDVDNVELPDDHTTKPQNTNILKHALNSNKDPAKIIKKDNKLYLYVVQHPEKENVESLSMDTNLCRPKVNPRSILKSSHAMFQTKSDVDCFNLPDERLNKRFAKGKEAIQAMLFHNFINKTTIPQAPVRKDRLPRKQKIKPVERTDEEIVVQEMMVSPNGFVETIGGGVNKENLAVTEYVELTDSDDDYDPKKVTRKKKKHRRKKIEILISDDSDASHVSVIDLDESDDETNSEEPKNANNNNTPPKRRRGRPPKNRTSTTSPTSVDFPAKKSKVEDEVENPGKPEIPCPKCNKTFPSQNSLKTHLQYHNLQSLQSRRALPEYKYKCDNCETTFINSILLKKHMCSKLFNCPICKNRFSDLSSLNGHKRTHAKEQMVKDTALAQVSPKIKPTHLFKAPKLSNFKCKVCSKFCSSFQNLSIHLKTHKECHTCTTCSKTFISQLMLEKHVRENCVKGLISRRSRIPSDKKSPVTSPRLRVRNSSAFAGRSPNKIQSSPFVVKCDKCGAQFKGHQALFRHKVQKHDLETPNKGDLNQQREPKGTRGLAPAKRLLSSYSDLKNKLNFNN